MFLIMLIYQNLLFFLNMAKYLFILINFIIINKIKSIEANNNLLKTSNTFVKNQSDVGQLEFRYEMFEEQPSETIIGDLVNDLKTLKLNYASLKYNNVQNNNFLILSQKINGKHIPQSSVTFFAVNSTSGILKLTKKIDREKLCSGTSVGHESCFVNLDILNSVESGGWPCFREILKITIEILDINDHKPVFGNIGHIFHASFSELAPVGSGSALPLAEDKDSVNFSIQNYLIEDISEIINVSSIRDNNSGSDNPISNRVTSKNNFSEFFRLDIQKLKENVDIILGVVLRVKSPLDRESQDVHWLKLLAVDGGNPPFQAELIIRVNVEDFNDNAPKFDKSIYEFEVDQANLSGEFAMGEVHASDADDGMNAEIRYFLDSCLLLSPTNWNYFHRSDSSEFDTSDVFFIDQISGEIFNRNVIWKIGETVNFKMIIKAEDQGEHRLDDRTTVFIRIIYSTIVASPNNSSTFNGKIINNYSHNHNNNLAKVILPETAAKLEIDRKDIKFSSVHFSFQVYENQPESTFIGVLILRNNKNGEAIKIDPNTKRNYSNDDISFRLKGNSVIQETFLLESLTGVFLTATELDREATDRYFFTVEVMHVYEGTTLVADEANVSVKVLDLNDNIPIITLVEKFSGSFKTFTAPKAQIFGIQDQRMSKYFELTFNLILPHFIPAGTILFTVHTSDLDEGPNAEIEVDTQSTNALLRFDFLNSEVEFISHHDCVHQEFISLILEACDGGMPKLCSSLEMLLTCPSESRNSTTNWTFAKAKTILGTMNTQLNLLAIGALTAILTFSMVLACFFIAGYIKNLTSKSGLNRTEKFKPVWSVKREGFVRPDVDFLKAPPPWGHDNLDNCLLHTTDV